MKKFISAIAIFFSVFGAHAFATDPNLRDAQRANVRGDYVSELAITVPLSGQGVAWAQGMLGNSYYTGKGVRKDEQEAIRLWKLSADGGQRAAQFNLGLLYDRDSVVFRDHRDVLVFKAHDEAVKWYKMAADGGHVTARLNLGYMYYSGRGVARDYQEALKWFNAAARAGDSNAQYNLGYMYEHGLGLTASAKDATWWYRQAASGGHQLAKNRLAGLGIR
jgi:TPR repeat protein